MKTYRMSKDLFRNMLLGRVELKQHTTWVEAERAKTRIHIAILVKSATALWPLGENFYI